MGAVDWPVLKLGELVDGLSAGVSVRSDSSSSNRPAVLKTSSVYLGRFDPKEAKSIIPVDIERARCSPKQDSFILSRMNTPSLVGAVGYVENDEPNLYLPDRLWLARARSPGSIDMRWLVYYLASDVGSRRIRELATGTSGSMKNIPKKSLLKLDITVPALGLQRQISIALSEVDSLVSSLERLIAKKQAIKQGMMQQLLTGKTRLPGFTATWHTHQVGTVCSVDPESISPATVAASDQIDYIAIEDVSRGTLLGSSRYKFGDAPSRARRALNPDDVLFGTVRPNLQSHARYGGGLARPVASTGFAVLRSSRNLTDPSFLSHWVLSDIVSNQIEKIIAGSSYPAVSSRDVRQLNIYLPPVEEQKKIGRILDDVDAEIKTLVSRLTIVQRIKQGMMQELLTGRTRLVPAETAHE